MFVTVGPRGPRAVINGQVLVLLKEHCTPSIAPHCSWLDSVAAHSPFCSCYRFTCSLTLYSLLFHITATLRKPWQHHLGGYQTFREFFACLFPIQVFCIKDARAGKQINLLPLPSINLLPLPSITRSTSGGCWIRWRVMSVVSWRVTHAIYVRSVTGAVTDVTVLSFPLFSIALLLLLEEIHYWWSQVRLLFG